MRIETSSIDVGSSAISTVGSTASARAIATRWRCPPESSCGYFAAYCSAGTSPTVSSSSWTRASTPPRDTRPWILSGRARWWRTVLTGFSEPNGSWKIIWTLRAVAQQRRAAASPRAVSAPSKSTCPAVGL